MSRVRDALKRANSMTSSAETEAIRRFSEAAWSREEPSEVSAPVAAGSLSRELPTEVPPLLRYRWVKRLLRDAGLRSNVPVRKCQGLTRMGQPCRGPAMANGFCRLHGGSRQGVVTEKTREMIGRVMPAR